MLGKAVIAGRSLARSAPWGRGKTDRLAPAREIRPGRRVLQGAPRVRGGGAAIFVGGNARCPNRARRFGAVTAIAAAAGSSSPSTGTGARPLPRLTFPFSRPELLARWVGNIGRGDFQPSSHTVLCSQHFQPDCFSAFGNRTNLKPNAVPTLFAFPRTVRDFTRTEDGRRLDEETVLHQEPQPSRTEEPIEELSERLSQTTRETDCVGESAEVTTKGSQDWLQPWQKSHHSKSEELATLQMV
ncbi:THAP domain-containing protein 3 isoform X4 [Mauremys reevesii]|uniref:THAP domain-containing protein 3 isoform X4 n=1 Tax=Mauremys reevesii TaxID=260615 RepID=UPI00193ECB1B|nr:THAP domain-containing protein 3 isoform X4 [Mauremys reevesii]